MKSNDQLLTDLTALLAILRSDREWAEERSKQATTIGDMRDHLGLAKGLTIAISRVQEQQSKSLDAREREAIKGAIDRGLL